MCTDAHHWHHDYVRLAWDSGFCFDIHKSKSNFDWNTIGLVDVERVARDRDIASVEKQIPKLLNFSLDDDQTRVLEPTFVKVFRLTQLSLQYLQFCKKYLDNTVVILKKDLSKCKEENANLHKGTEEYVLEISNLKKKIKDIKVLSQCEQAMTGNETFKCNDCSKMFLNEEFLTAHVKRRHNIKDDLLQTETNKLQLEIKELKERLNCTEKYIQSDHNLDIKEKSPVPNNDIAAVQHIGQVVDLQDKFEQLKHHVERELNMLRDQKQYQEKYEKWFEMVFLRLDHSKQELQNKDDKLFKENNADGDGDKSIKKEISTQTIAESESEVMPGENVSEIIENKTHLLEINIQKIQEDIRINNETHIEQIQGVLEQKLTGGFEQIQTQMQTFWKKMNDMEIEKERDFNINSEKNIEILGNPIDDQQVIKPKPAPRIAKYPSKIQSKPIIHADNVNDTKNESQQLHTPCQIIYSSLDSPINSCKKSIDHAAKIEIVSPKPENVAKPEAKEGTEWTLKPVTVMHEGHALTKERNRSNVKSMKYFSTSESETSETEKQSTTHIKQSSISTLARRSITSIKEAVKQKEVLEGLKTELQDMVNIRLKEVGVSEHWTGLPNRSFKQVLQVINHQAQLTAKKYSNYSVVRKEILKNLERQMVRNRNINIREVSINNSLKTKKSKSKVKQEMKKAESKVSKFSRQVEMKKKIPNTIKVDNHHRNSKHINEMFGAREDETSDISEIDENKKADVHQHKVKHVTISKIKLQTPIKKKVFFDLKDSSRSSSRSSEVVLRKKLFVPQKVNEHKLEQDTEINIDIGKKNSPGEKNNSLDINKINDVINLNDGGSTTSFPSSVLDGPKQHLNATPVEHINIKPTKDDTSDWDISDILI